MPRIRSIHPEACTSEKLAEVGAEAERCYWRLQTHCDDEGRCEDHPRLIWAALFPLHDDVDPAKVDAWLEDLDDAGLIVRYSADGKRYLAVTQWGRFQHPQKPRPSKLPAPSCAVPEPVADPSRTPTVLVAPGEGEGDGVGDGDLATVKPSRRDPLWDAIIDCWGIDQAELTTAERGRLNKATGMLRAITADPDEIPHRRAALQRMFPNVTWTPMAVASRWAEANGNGSVSQGRGDLGAIDAALGRAP